MTNRYVPNPACDCVWCTNNGTPPAWHPDRGHAYGYETPHNPPCASSPWSTSTTNPQASNTN